MFAGVMEEIQCCVCIEGTFPIDMLLLLNDNMLVVLGPSTLLSPMYEPNES